MEAIMRRIILACALAGVLAVPADALDGTPLPPDTVPTFNAAPLDLPAGLLAQAVNQAAAAETVTWRHVQYAASLQTLQVGDVDGHSLALQRLSGMAFFSDVSIGTSSVIGT
jgi:hypothetical protein